MFPEDIRARLKCNSVNYDTPVYFPAEMNINREQICTNFDQIDIQNFKNQASKTAK